MDANDIKIVLNQMLVDYSNYFNQYNICIYKKSLNILGVKFFFFFFFFAATTYFLWLT